MSSVRSLIIAPCAIVSPGDWHICSIAGVSYSINELVKPYNLRRGRLMMCVGGGVSFFPLPQFTPSFSAADLLRRGGGGHAPPLPFPPPGVLFFPPQSPT